MLEASFNLFVDRIENHIISVLLFLRAIFADAAFFLL